MKPIHDSHFKFGTTIAVVHSHALTYKIAVSQLHSNLKILPEKPQSTMLIKIRPI
jgi:hypothetical protein